MITPGSNTFETGESSHPDLLKTRQKKRAVQWLSTYVTLVLCAWAVRKGAVKLWLRVYLARQDVFFHFGVEGFMKGGYTRTLNPGQMPKLR